MRKIVLTFGLIAGAIMALMMFLAMFFKDQIGFGEKGMIIGYTSMVLAFLMVFVGIKSYRDNVAGGQVSFGRAFKVGALIAAVGCVCYVAAWQVLYRTMAPDYMDKYAAYSIEKERRAGATEAQLAARTEEMAKFREMYKNPLVNIAVTLLEPLPVALVFTLVSAGVLSRKRRPDGALAVQT
jgi:hypothetical protein